MTTVPGYLAGHVEDLAALQARVAHARWLAATGQSDDPPALPESGLGRLTDGGLVLLALEHGDLHYAGELVLWYFRVRLTEATARLRLLQRTVTAEAGGRTLTHGELVALSRTVTDERRRAEVRAALADVGERLREGRRRWLDAYAEARAELGFPTHAALVRALHPEVDRFVAHARNWLDATRAEFLRRWDGWRTRDAISAPSMGDARLVAARAVLPEGAGGALDGVRSTVREWGFGGCLERVVVDDVARPGKSGTAFCSPVAPPADVRVSVTPGTTLGHHATLLHEFGHALHFTAGTRHPADLWRTHPALTEAFGFTLERVVRRPDWQRRHLGVTVDAEAVERLAFAREHVRRLVATSLCYEMAVHDGHPDPAAEYVRSYEREFGVAVDGGAAWDRLQTYLEGKPCYPLLYHQAFMLSETLWDQLTGRAGERWYAGPDAGPAMRELFESFAAGAGAEEWLSPGGVPLGQVDGEGEFGPGRAGQPDEPVIGGQAVDHAERVP